jgi:hypothetical protein
MGLDLNALLAKTRATIGDLTMERDALRVQVEQREKQIAIILEAGVTEEAPEPTEEEITGEAEEGPPKGETVD